jgi:PAS domain S-box-containing protein
LWINERLPTLRRNEGFGYVIAAGLISLAMLLTLFFPALPPFVTIYPAVLLSAFLGGMAPGFAALVTGFVFAWFMFSKPEARLEYWEGVSLLAYLLVGGLMIFIVGLLDEAVRRLQNERERLELALRAADAGAWEWSPPDRLTWDKSFAELIGVDPASHESSIEFFMSLVHPDDRQKLRGSWENIIGNPSKKDEYRLVRPDGRVIWLENSRAVAFDGIKHIIGITQDITKRKENESRIMELMREVAHRVKNQYAVILGIVRETAKQAPSAQAFEAQIQSRIAGLAKSHDLLVSGDWIGATIEDLVRAQLEPFCTPARCDVTGPLVLLRPMGVQYLGMAIHELATNSAKHGALSVEQGRLAVNWTVDPAKPDGCLLTLTWKENGGPSVLMTAASGFGRQVLEKLAPRALGGTGELKFVPDGVQWILKTDESSIASYSAGPALPRHSGESRNPPMYHGQT